MIKIIYINKDILKNYFLTIMYCGEDFSIMYR